MTYSQVFAKALEDQPQAEVMDCATNGAAISDLILQYEESGWEFLIRLASRFQTFLIPDACAGYGRVYFGIPEGEDEEVLNTGEYQAVKDMGRYYQVNLDGELLSQEIMKWQVRSERSFSLAQRVMFCDIETIVTRVCYETVKGELCRFYELSRKKGVLSVPQYNEKIAGMSIPATVKERSGNCVRVHFHIDPEYAACSNQKYFVYAIESSFIYCMPEVGSQVHIYFPTSDEGSAIGIHAIRMKVAGGSGQPGGGQSGGGYAQNPDCKSFSNVDGAVLQLTPDSASAAADRGMLTCVHLGRTGNASIQGMDVVLEAGGTFSMGEPSGEDGKPVEELQVEGAEITVQVGEGDGTQIVITDEVKVIADEVLLNASISVPVSPSPEAIASELTAGDKEARDNANLEVMQPAVEKYVEGKKKVGDFITNSAAAGGVICLLGVISVFTGGAAAVPAGVIAAAATNVGISASEGYEGLQDMKKARKGDTSESFNVLRDMVASPYFGPSHKQAVFDFAKLTSNVVFGVVSGKALGAAADGLVAQRFGNAACKGAKAVAVSSTIHVGYNVGIGIIQNLSHTGKVGFGDILINMGIGITQGYIGNKTTQALIKNINFLGTSPLLAKGTEFAVDTLFDTLVDGVMSGLAGKEFNFWESLQKNGWANIVAMSIHDPVDAVSGAYVIQTTDVILASLPSALKLERTYRSTSNDASVFGKGWTFSYGSRIYRDTGNSRRIHLDAITGHSLCFEAKEGEWVNTSRGTSQYSLKVTDENHFLLTNHQEHTVCVYDREGYLVRVEYPNRQHLTFIYNQEGLSRIVTPLGGCLEVVSEKGKIVQITDGIKRRTQYRYDGDLLTDVVHADQGIVHYEYDEDGRIRSVKDENGVRYLENEYDRQGRMIRQRFQDGSVAEVIYDDSKRTNTSINRANGRKEVYRYNRDQLVEQVLYEDGTSLTMEYSDQCLPVTRTNRTGARTVWEYDSFGNVIREVQPDGYERHYEYDQNQDLVREWDSEGRETLRCYDKEHNLLSEKEKIGEGQWKETVYSYDSKGRKTSMQDGVGNKTIYEFAENRAYPDAVITPEKEETRYDYDRVGRRMEIENDYGRVSLSYNSRNYVVRRTDGEGHTAAWNYDRMGKVAAYYPPKQWESQRPGYEYRYDFLERLVDVVTPLEEHSRRLLNLDGKVVKQIHPVSYEEKGEDGEGTGYEYDHYGNCIRIHYADGGTERRFYDPDGNLIRQVLPEAYDPGRDDGDGFTYTYDAAGRLIHIQDPEGNQLQEYEYNGHGQVIREVDGEGKETLYAYNGLGLKIREQVSIRKEDDNIWYRVIRYEYDLQGNKTEEAYGQNEVMENQEPTGWHRIRFGYDKNNHLTSVEDDFGAKVRYEYDCLGNRILEEQVIEDGIRRKVRYQYNKSGWRIQKKETIQGNGPIRSAITRYEYDANGNVIKVITPKGAEIHYSYDADDRVIQRQVLDKKNGIDRRTVYRYDAAGNRIGESVKGADTNALETFYQFDRKDRKTHQIMPGGAVTRYVYDRNDQLIQEISPYGYEAEADCGKGTVYQYDSRGNRIRETNVLGEVVEERGYNLRNEPIQWTDGLGNGKEIEYTLDGQVREVRRGRKSGEKENIGQGRISQNLAGQNQQHNPIQQYEYNARGEIVGIVDGVGEKIGYDMDSWGRITSVNFSDGVKEGYEYTPSGQVKKTVDGNGNFVQYFYNSLGKVRERIDQTGEKETFQYDEEGNLQLYTDRDGNQIYRLYNVFGEPVYEKAADKNGESPCLTTFRYDSMGRLVQAVGNGHSYEYEYNEQGYLKEKRSSGKRLIFYEYDKAGNITCMTDPAGVKTCYSYDLLGRTSRVYNGNGLEVQYSYDCQNRIEQITYGNGIQTRYEYDRDGNLAVLETKAEEKVLFSLACQYDGNGNRVEKKGIQCLAGDEIVPIHTTYQYDIRGQLLEENHQGEPVGVVFRYGYDASGNRISKEENGRRTIYAYNGKNQVVTEESAQEKIHFTYNQQGSMISREGSSGMSRFFYNSKNQQIRTETEDGQVQENRYDAEGLRYEVRENANRIRFVYHQGELLYEKGGEESSYHQGGGIEAVWRSEKTHYYHQDEQLSTVFITNEKRQIQNYYQYDAFGNGIS